MMNKILWALACVLVAISITEPVGDPDLWWHIVVGRWILAHGEVPQVDLWNQFAAGAPWRAYSWSNEIVYAWVESISKGLGLLTLKVLLALSLAVSLSLIAADIAKHRVLGLIAGLSATIGCYAHFALRPQVISWICFALCLFVSERALRKGISTGLALLLIATMMLWTNSHISMIFGLFAIIIWTFDISRIRGSLILSSKLLGLAFLGTLITPYFGGEWITLLSKAQHPFAHMYIREFQPATVHHVGANIVILLFTVLLILIRKNPRILNPTQVCGAVVFFFAALSVQKFIPISAIYLSLLIARSWSLSSQPEEDFGNLGFALEKMLAVLGKLRVWASISLSLLACLFIWGLSRPLLAAPLDYKRVPIAPLDFIKENKAPLPILNTFNDGGYILYRYSNQDGTPTLKVALDGRTNVNTTEATTGFLSAYRAALNWESYLELVNPKTILWDNSFPLVSVLLETEEWCHVYPSAQEAISSSRWSVFISKDEFPNTDLVSRNCSQENNEVQ